MASRSESSRPVALVTGATGFTGRYVSAGLEREGFVVHGWGAHGDAAAARAVDLTDRAAVRDALGEVRPDVVIHLAAIAFVAHGNVDEMYLLNVVGTRNLLEALSDAPVRPRHVVLASSANIYGNAGGMLDEATPPSPQNDYAVSKLAMEYMAALWTDKLPITIARPFNYTGVGQSEKFLLPKIVAHFRAGAPVIELGNIDVSRDFNDVRNVAECYVRLVQGEAGGAVNICSGIEHSLREVIQMMERIAGYDIEVKVNKAFVRDNEVKRLLGDAGRLRARIGDIARIPLKRTLEWMYREGN